MRCYYDFLIGDNQQVSIPIDSEDGNLILNDELLTSLENNPELRQQISDLLYEELNKSKSAKSITFNDLVKKGALIANTNLEFLKSEYPNVFPENAKAEVLLVEKLKEFGTPISGRILNSKGKEIFVIDGSDRDIYKLANYLKLREQYEIGAANFEDKTGIIKKILKDTKFKDLSSLLIDFNNNDSKYLNKFIKN